MPWNGQKDCLIDRFDVRAHLDFIPPVQKVDSAESEEVSQEERQLNYERFRILAQNEFLGINEEKFLHQLYLEELYGVNAQYEMEKTSKKKNSSAGAAIGYSYDNEETTTSFSQTINSIESAKFEDDPQKEDSESDVDMDVSIDITKIQTSQAHELNTCGRHYGMVSNDFYSFLTKDYDEAESLKIAREEEAEKIMLVGRKSRRERRAQREKKYLGRPLSPPSYAAKEEKNITETFENDDESRSPSPENSGKITYITSFGGEDELQPHSKISITLNKPTKAETNVTSQQLSYADKVRENLDKLKKMNSYEKSREEKKRVRSRSRSRRRSRSSSRKSLKRRGRGGRSRSRSRSSYRRKRHKSSSSSSSSRSRSRRRKTKSRTRSPIKRKVSSSSSSSATSSSSSSSVSPVRLYKKSSSSSSSTSSTRSKSPVKAAEKSKSKTPILMQIDVPVPKVPETTIMVPEPPPVKKYYGRKRENESSSEVSVSEGEEENKLASNERFVDDFRIPGFGDIYNLWQISNFLVNLRGYAENFKFSRESSVFYVNFWIFENVYES